MLNLVELFHSLKSMLLFCRSYNSIGNRRLRVTVSMFLDQYNEAEGMTTERSRIITKVMRIMSECCPIGAFIKFENGRYWQLSEKASREKVSALFRDCSQAQAQTKTNKPNNKRKMNSRRGSMVEGYLYDVALVVSGKKRLSMNDSASSSSTSKRSFYDIDTKQMVSLANYDDEVSVGSAGSVLLC